MDQERADYDDRPGRRRAWPLLHIAILLFILMLYLPLTAFATVIVGLILAGGMQH